MTAQYVCLRNTAHSSSGCLLNPHNTEYHKTCVQNPCTWHEYLQIYATKIILAKYPGERYQAHLNLLLGQLQYLF